MATTERMEMRDDKHQMAVDTRVREWLAQQRIYAKRTGNKVRAEAIHRRIQKWEQAIAGSNWV